MIRSSAAITAFNAQERARGFLMPATPDEINKALAEASVASSGTLVTSASVSRSPASRSS
jgi:hypothetical protein